MKDYGCQALETKQLLQGMGVDGDENHRDCVFSSSLI